MASRRRKRARRGTDGIAAAVAGAAAVVLAASAAGLVVALAPAAPPVEEVAATVPAPAAAPWTRSTPAVPGPVVGTGAQAQSAGPGMAVPQPPRPVRTGLVITPFVGVGKSPELTPRPPSCGGHTTPRQMAPGVVPGPGGSATVSWQAGGRAEVVGYRVTAVSQTLRPGLQPAPLQRTVAQPADCGPVTLAVAGLTPGDAYVFWLEERTVDAVTSVERFVQVGSSSSVVIGP
jgi:hypothetical protein